MHPTTSQQSSAKKSTVRKLGKGYLRGIILAMLEEHPRYGYEILHAIAKASDGWRPSPGSIYPILHDLYNKGLITKKEVKKNGRRRIIYKIGAEGKTRLKHNAMEHARFVAIMRKILVKHGDPFFLGSPAFNVDKALWRLQHANLLLDEAPILPKEVVSDIDHSVILLKRRLRLLEKHAKHIENAMQKVKQAIQNLEKKSP